MQHAARTTALLVAALFALLASPLTADVLVVAHDGSGDFVDIGPAIQASSAGDVILIRPGNYVPSFAQEPDSIVAIEARDLTLVGDGPGVLVGPIIVRHVAAQQRVILRQLEIVSGATLGVIADGLRVTDCAGEVLVEDCVVRARKGAATSPVGGTAVLVDGADGVSFARCTLIGGAGHSPQQGDVLFVQPGAGGVALDAQDGDVTLYHCTLDGGSGGTDLFFGNGGRTGGTALELVDATARAYGSTLSGGSGGDACAVRDAGDCAGGDGALLGSGAVLRSVGSASLAGAGGELVDASQAPDGEAVVLDGGVHVALPDSVARLSGPAVAREGETFTLTVLGEPGHGVRLFLSVDSGYSPLGGKKGVFIPGLPLFGPVVVGNVPASGVFELTLPAPELAGLDGFVANLQGYTTPGAGLTLTSPLQLVFVAPDL